MKDNKQPILILIIIFIIGGFAFSPFKKAAEKRQAEKTQTQNASSLGTTSTTPNLEYSNDKEIAQNIKDAEANIKNLEEEAKRQKELNQRSPYYDKVSMSGVVGLNNAEPDQEYITLYSYLPANQTVKITGWYLKSELTGNFAYIPKAALLPFPFTKTETDVTLGQYDRVILTKGFSPIGISFRTNKCTGYFEENRTFYPPLSLECPVPQEEDLPTFSSNLDRQDECVDTVRRVGRCTTRGSEFFRTLPDTVVSSCKTFIETQINYNSCVANHFSDTDFPGTEYRLYLNKFGLLWRSRNEKINLYDENNLIVASISF